MCLTFLTFLRHAIAGKKEMLDIARKELWVNEEKKLWFPGSDAFICRENKTVACRLIFQAATDYSSIG